MAGERICIDAFNLSMPKGSGIATYARGLIPTIRALGCEPQLLFGPTQEPAGPNLLNEALLFDAPREAPRPRRRTWWQAWRRPPPGPRAVKVTASGDVIDGLGSPWLGGAKSAWAALDIFHRANREHGRSGAFTDLALGAPDEAAIDLMHWTCPLPIRAEGAPNVYTIHDLVPLQLPYATLDNKARFWSLIERICKEADHVVTVSETTRTDVMRIFGIDAGRITSTWQAVDIADGVAGRDEAEAAAEIENIFRVSWRGYFLFFGALEPKKNLARILEAFLAAGVTAPLVIVGGRAWLDEGHGPFLAPHVAGDRVRVIDYLPRPLLATLTRGARATLFASLHEGFGLPAVEAMALGTPVLASTGGALPEICGEAAMLVDAFDVTAIKRAIQALDADADLRAALAHKGRARAADFSVERCAERLTPVYRALL